MEKSLREAGHVIVGLPDSPEVCIVNTCTVTSKSDMQSRQLIRKALKTGARVLATGCYADLNPQDIEKIDENIEIHKNIIKPYIINEFIHISSEKTSTTVSSIGQRSKYFLKVQDGCDNSCTYCRIWMARGESRSIKLEEVLESARMAEQSGYREIVLTGIHLGMYGRDLVGGWGVSKLLEELLRTTSMCRFRLSSLEVGEIDEHLLELMGDSRVCDHLHVPLQGGHDSVLKDMGRNYTVREYSDTIELINSKLGDIGLGSDIIAGFPTETREAFENTLNLVKKLPFTYLHVFPYSARPGTMASKLPDIVENIEKKNRAAMLREIGLAKKKAYMESQKGKVLSVLCEQAGEDGIMGTSYNYLKVNVNLNTQELSNIDDIKGKLVNIRVSGVKGAHLAGDAIEIL